MPKLTILSGVSGSGKSTWAEAQTGVVVVSRDKFRALLFGSDGPEYYKVDKALLKRREDYITKVEHEAIASALRAGMDVISDNTNVRPKYMKSIVDIGFKSGATVERKVVDVPLAVALERNAARGKAGGRLVPEKVIREQYDALKSSLNWKPEAPPLPKHYHGTPGKPKAILVDIDGTLAHMKDHRGAFDWKNVGKDEPDFNVFQIISWIRQGMQAEGGVYPWGERAKIILMSGRDEVCRQETIDWLTSWDFGDFDHLFMRPQGDMRKDSIIKAELFDAHVRDNYDVVMVFDDRNQVVDMWRSMGVQVAQVAEGDF